MSIAQRKTCSGTGVFGSVLLDDPVRAVRGAVVYAYDLERLEGLGGDTVQALAEVFGRVVDGDDH